MAKLRAGKPTYSIVDKAYHGTELSVAKKIDKGEKFRGDISKRDPEELFLGEGVYFFEGSKDWAEIWAKRQYPDHGILCGSVRLGSCLDFNTMEAIQIIRLVRDKISERTLVPRNKIKLPAAISYYVTNIDKELETIRATNAKCHRRPEFEGKIPLYLCEAIICVRNINNISGVSLVDEGAGNG